MRIPFPLPVLLTGGLLALALPAQADKPQDKPATKQKPMVLAVGDVVPADLALTDIDGKPLRFGDLRGKTVVLHFWSIVCPYEKVAEPKMLGIADRYRDRDVVVLAVNANAPEIGSPPEPEQFEAEDKAARPYPDIRKHLDTVRFNHRVLVDHTGEVVRRLGGKTTPHCFVIDAKGVIRYQGALDNDPRGRLGDEAERYVVDALEAVLAGEEVAKPVTKPYG